MRILSWIACSRANIVVDLQHALFGVALSGKQYLAPINPDLYPDLYRVLDIATGRIKYQMTLLSPS